MLSNIGNSILFISAFLSISIIYLANKNLKASNNLIIKNIYQSIEHHHRISNRPLPCYDQPIVNKLAYSNKIVNNKLLNNKKGLVLGIANDRSLAWGVAEFVANSGGNLALTYQSEALKKRVVPLSEKIKTEHVYQCDVQDYQDLPIFFQNLSKDFEQ